MDNRIRNDNVSPLVWIESVVDSFFEIPLSNCERYRAIEVQQLRVGAKVGYLAVFYLHNGSINLLHEKQLPLDRQWANSDPAMVGMNVNVIGVFDYIRIEKYKIEPTSVILMGEFKDDAGSLISVDIKTNRRLNPKPLFTPAPRKPAKKGNSGLRFLQLNFFALLPISSKICLKIDAIEQRATPFLLPPFLARYSSTRVGANLLLASLSVRGQSGSDDINNRYSQLLKISPGDSRIGTEDQWFELSHTPAIESQREVDAAEVFGQIVVHSALGKVASGNYSIKRKESGIEYRIQNVTQNWFPGFIPLPRFCLFVIRVLRRGSNNWSATH